MYIDRALEQFREAHVHFHELRDAHA
jgi:hypothetical protein